MKSDQAKQIADKALSTLTDALAQGHSDALRRYLAMMGKFHHYSFRNVCLIVMQCPHATQVAGFGTWKQMGRYVKAGEKGIVIVAPMVKATHDESEQADHTSTDAATKQDASQPRIRFRGTYVFDISQTDGQPLPELGKVAGDPGGHLPALRELITSRGIKLDHENLPEGCGGVSRGGHISIRSGLPAAEEFSVTVHELAHELLNHADKASRPPKIVRETQAEAVAFVVCSAIGLDTGSAAKDYIQLYQGDAKLLIANLDQVQKVASTILAGLGAEHPVA